MIPQIRLIKAFVRVMSLPYFFSILFTLLLVPQQVMFALHRELPLSSAAVVGLIALGLQLILNIIVGFGLWFFAGSIARLIGKDLAQAPNQSLEPTAGRRDAHI